MHEAPFLIRVMVVGGLLFRIWHYLANHTIWYDESVLLVNVMEKDFGQLLGPMHHAVAAPPLFVWLLKLIHLGFGDVSSLWRLVPFVFSVLLLFVVVPLARQVLDPPAAVLAIGLVAVSDGLIWLGCTVKPYEGETAIAAALLMFLVKSRIWPITKRLTVLAVLFPVLFCFSYTTVFVAGGLFLALLPAAWQGGTGARLAWLTAAATATGTLALLYFGPMKAQRVPTLVYEWRFHFPNYEDPLSIPWWLIRAYFGVCQQACNPSGCVLGFFVPVGAWVLWRAGQRELVTASLGVFGMAMVAAMVKAYPLGQHRLSQFLTPAVILLGCAGVGEVIRRWHRFGVVLAVLLFCVADGLSLSHLVVPWEQPNAVAVTRHVKAHRQPGDVILSDEGNYLYFFFNEVEPIANGAAVPAGGRAWVLMDFYTDAERRDYIERQLEPLGFELRESKQFLKSAAYLYVRKQ